MISEQNQYVTVDLWGRGGTVIVLSPSPPPPVSTWYPLILLSPGPSPVNVYSSRTPSSSSLSMPPCISLSSESASISAATRALSSSADSLSSAVGVTDGLSSTAYV